jgi:hypothetical protein
MSVHHPYKVHLSLHAKENIKISKLLEPIRHTFRSSATTKVIGSCIASIEARRFRNRCGMITPPR